MSTLSRLSLLRTPKETRDSTVTVLKSPRTRFSRHPSLRVAAAAAASLSTASPIHKWRYACFRQEDSSSEEVFEVGDGFLEEFTKPEKWRYACFRQEDSSSEEVFEVGDGFLEEFTKPESDNSNVLRRDWGSGIGKVADSVFGAEPWTVPWTAMTILQVMLLWFASFYLVGSWIIPFIAHAAGFRKESLTYRGQALYSLLTDVAEGLTGIAILHRCLSKFRPLPSDWFKFRFGGKWHFDVSLGCLMFPLVNRLSQVNLNLIPILPSTPVTVSSVEQSIVARDPVAMVLYAVVVSVCAPIWEEIVFRGFLLPSLTKYMPVWCSILVSSVAFALAHFNMQRMLPLVFLGVVMGAVFARTRNLLASILLHSLWNAFVFLDLMK